MPARHLGLALAGLALTFAGCASTTGGPSVEASAPGEPAPTVATTAPPSPSLEPSLEASPSPTSPPVASGVVDPAAFSTVVDNPWLPLVPGTTLTYQGTKDGKKAVETFNVTADTKVVDGVACVVVEDKVSLGGEPAERLVGYYAQDRDGNVWYFGEDTQEIDAGQVVSTEGSWRAGVDNAPPALVMEAMPTVGKTITHDYTANDYAVLSLAEKVTVPFGSYDALVTKEWSPLEPDVETHKYYARGVGLVRDVAAKGPTEEFRLVKVEHS
jgi:hypothetical protein